MWRAFSRTPSCSRSWEAEGQEPAPAPNSPRAGEGEGVRDKGCASIQRLRTSAFVIRRLRIPGECQCDRVNSCMCDSSTIPNPVTRYHHPILRTPPKTRKSGYFRYISILLTDYQFCVFAPRTDRLELAVVVDDPRRRPSMPTARAHRPPPAELHRVFMSRITYPINLSTQTRILELAIS